MIDRKGIQKETMCENYCACSVCEDKQKVGIEREICSQKEGGINSMQVLLDYIPRNYPLYLTPTAFTKGKLHYSNKFGNRVATQSFNKITQHFPLATNIVLYYSKRTTICYKYELMHENQSFQYIQAYTTQIPIPIEYIKDERSFMDEMLEEKIMEILREIVNDDYFNASEKNKEFLKWVHCEYGDQIYCKYITTILFLFLEKKQKDRFISAKLQWLIEKPGIARLHNVKDLKVEKVVETKSFQEEYEQKIKERLNSQNALQINLFNASTPKQKLGSRMNNFKNKIRKIYENEKMSILKQTQKQRHNESKIMSDQVARLFLPQLHKYSNLREVLNDEEKFKKVVLGVETKEKEKTKLSPIKRGKEKKVESRFHVRSKTEV